MKCCFILIHWTLVCVLLLSAVAHPWGRLPLTLPPLVAMTTSPSTIQRNTLPWWNYWVLSRKVTWLSCDMITTTSITIYLGGGECGLFVSLTNQMQSLNEQAHTFAFDILFSQLKQKLSKVPLLKVRLVSDIRSWNEIVSSSFRFGRLVLVVHWRVLEHSPMIFHPSLYHHCPTSLRYYCLFNASSTSIHLC